MASRRASFKQGRKGGQKQPYMSKNMKKKLKQEQAGRPPKTKYQRNLKHIERAREAIQAQKRQIETERKYRQEVNSAAGAVGYASSDTDASDGGEKGTGTIEDLATEFNEQIGQTVESEDERDSAMEDAEQEQDDSGALASYSDNDAEEEGEALDVEEDEEYEELLPDVSDLASDEDDPYLLHTAHNLSTSLVEALDAEPPRVETTTMSFGSLGHVVVEVPKVRPTSTKSEVRGKPGTLLTVPEASDEDTIEWGKLHVKDRIVHNMTEKMDALQRDTFAILNGYRDLYLPQRSFENANRLRYVYCLHVLNHVLKAVSKIQHHTIKLITNRKAGRKKPAEDQFRRRLKEQKEVKVGEKPTVGDDEYRDQGFVRPKVLIIVPFRESALRCVTVLKRLFAGDQESSVINWKRFTDEYGGGPSLHFPRRNPKHADYERTFAGNIDDNFRLGIAFNRSTMKLYAKFYSSDVIIASPLGLRMTIGAKGEQHRDYDYLASIELLIIDQAEVCYAQNWDNILHIMDHLHQQPKSTEYTEFSRVREWCLNGWSKFYRQTVLLSAFEVPEFRWLYNKHFRNYRGKVRLCNRPTFGTVKNVVLRVPQSFLRIETATLASAGTARFSHFLHVVLPQARSVTMARSLIYVPSYFDFIRLRNHFKNEELSFTQICEYTTDAKIARARDMFYHGSKHFLLYSERAHFFRRHRIRGVRHLIFYAPPVYPHFYSELVNLMTKEYQNPHDGVDDESMTVTVLYTAYDMYQLTALVGASRAKAMIKAPRSVHRFSTDQK
ncbi:U3 small nucleolar RNA-associated protein 25 homolog [Anopheles maculipalpis]|uniref:U3 small nucleolar RNA-associated protein 25 homolog n=1 Tax=Anopheles maculipalpis TaxID=1496333 RepID=UPI0021594D6B|nr:U3 small nucleolar RNA-associated protein 25 homolog [Anopheles maculipalpis]